MRNGDLMSPALLVGPVPFSAALVGWLLPRQFRSIEGWMPNSAATWDSGRPLPCSSDTASRLNSSVNSRRVFVVIRAPRSQWSLSEVSTVPGEGQRAFCQGQIAHQKVPRYVQFVDEFPMTVTGKAQKFIMRRVVEEQLGLKRAETA